MGKEENLLEYSLQTVLANHRFQKQTGVYLVLAIMHDELSISSKTLFQYILNIHGRSSTCLRGIVAFLVCWMAFGIDKEFRGIKKRLWRFIELLRREGHVDESNELKLGILRGWGADRAARGRPVRWTKAWKLPVIHSQETVGTKKGLGVVDIFRSKLREDTTPRNRKDEVLRQAMVSTREEITSMSVPSDQIQAKVAVPALQTNPLPESVRPRASTSTTNSASSNFISKSKDPPRINASAEKLADSNMSRPPKPEPISTPSLVNSSLRPGGMRSLGLRKNNQPPDPLPAAKANSSQIPTTVQNDRLSVPCPPPRSRRRSLSATDHPSSPDASVAASRPRGDTVEGSAPPVPQRTKSRPLPERPPRGISPPARTVSAAPLSNTISRVARSNSDVYRYSDRIYLDEHGKLSLFQKSKLRNDLPSTMIGSDILPLEVLAMELTRMESHLFRSINLWEFLHMRWQRKDKHAKAPILSTMVERFNQVSFWVASSICGVKELQNRVMLVEQFISLSELCVCAKNYNSAFEILGGLNNIAVRRLHDTWSALSAKAKERFDSLNEKFDSADNYKTYRMELVGHTGPIVPFIGVLCRDMAFVEAGNTGFDTDMDFRKIARIGTILSTVRKFQAYSFHLKSDDKFTRTYLKTSIREVPSNPDDCLWELSERVERRKRGLRKTVSTRRPMSAQIPATKKPSIESSPAAASSSMPKAQSAPEGKQPPHPARVPPLSMPSKAIPTTTAKKKFASLKETTSNNLSPSSTAGKLQRAESVKEMEAQRILFQHRTVQLMEDNNAEMFGTHMISPRSPRGNVHAATGSQRDSIPPTVRSVSQTEILQFIDHSSQAFSLSHSLDSKMVLDARRVTYNIPMSESEVGVGWEGIEEFSFRKLPSKPRQHDTRWEERRSSVLAQEMGVEEEHYDNLYQKALAGANWSKKSEKEIMQNLGVGSDDMRLYRERQPSSAHPTQLSCEHSISEPFDATRRNRKEVAQELGLTTGRKPEAE